MKLKKWQPVYLNVDPMASMFLFDPVVPNMIGLEPHAPSERVRLAHMYEWRAVTAKAIGQVSDDTLGLTDKVAAVLGYGWTLVVRDDQPEYYQDQYGAC